MADPARELTGKARGMAPVPPGPDGLPLEFVRKCYSMNTVGDGYLFAVMHDGIYIYDANTKDTWYRFEGHHWVQDVEGYALGDVERVVEAYAPLLIPHYERQEELREEMGAEDDKDTLKTLTSDLKVAQRAARAIERRIERLRDPAGRKNVLHCASTGRPRVFEYEEVIKLKPLQQEQQEPQEGGESAKDGQSGRRRPARGARQRKVKRSLKINPLVITTDAFDSHPMLLPVANGVVDLETGRLRPGRPGDLLTKAAAVPYPESEPGPPESFLEFLETALGSWEMVEYMQRLLGYSIMGRIDDHIFVMLFSERGRSGKTTLMEIIFTILADLASPIPAEMLLRQKTPRNSAGPSPDIMLFKGRRLVCASETDEGRRFDIASIKLFSGGDRMQARAPHDRKPTTWLPTHTLWMLTNFPPHAPAQDEAFWERFRFIRFPFTFKDTPRKDWERPIIRGLIRTLMQEAPAILHWMVKGALIYQQSGLQDPRQVIEDKAEYRKGEDTMEDFLKECCDRCDMPGCQETVRDLYEVFRRWWRVRVGPRPISKNLFSRRIKIKFGEPKKINGYPVYEGIKLKEMDWEEYFRQ